MKSNKYQQRIIVDFSSIADHPIREVWSRIIQVSVWNIIIQLAIAINMDHIIQS